MKDKINIICGATASGKTKYAVELAKRIDAEIINADSMQVYKELPILTAQPTLAEMENLPHHLYSIVSCGEAFDVAKWIKLAVDKIKVVQQRGKTPLLVGGTGMYIKSLIFGISMVPSVPIAIKQQVKELGHQYSQAELYQLLVQKDPKTAARLNSNDHQRTLRGLEVILATGVSLVNWQQQTSISAFPRYRFHLIYLTRSREVIYQNINKRFLEMLELGVIEEVTALYNKLGNQHLPKAHGLPELISYINGTITLQEAIRFSQRNIRNYAKRQATWFRHQLNFDEKVH